MLNNKQNGKTTYFNTAQITCPAAPAILAVRQSNPKAANPGKMIPKTELLSGTSIQFNFG